jgi:hypothetical protein
MCGSTRFAKEIRDFTKKLKDLGVHVYEPYLYSALGGNWEQIAEFDKKFVALGLTHDHFYKIRMADVVFVFNKDGYVGNSTTLEIGYSVALNKPIFALSELEEEICRRVLFREIVSTPEALAKFL